MSYELIITEKPSAALKMAYSLADSKPVKKSNKGVPYYLLSHGGVDIAIVPAVGHLFGVAEKKSKFTYPSFDIEWVPTSEMTKSAAYTKKYADTIKLLSKDAKNFTVACDYDIEGEVIGLNCVRFLCNQKDANRMKFSTLTKPDLINSFENRANTLNWGQANAGETRHFLDWLYGINLSRALTLAIKKKGMKKTLSTGRVQGPALKIVVDREKEIKDFKPTIYWTLELKASVEKGEFVAWHEKDRFENDSEAEDIVKKVEGKTGKVSSVEKKEKKHIPPYAFDLTTLQMESYRSLKISPKQTLALAQRLYLAGMISYPRTGSQKLPPSIGYKKILSAIQKDDNYSKICSEILSKEKIYPRQGAKDDPAHPAIFPTGNKSKSLKGQEAQVYDLIVRRFLSAFGDAADRLQTIMKVDVEKEIFVADGTHTLNRGWYEYYGRHLKVKEVKIPEASKGEAVKVDNILKHEKETEPPRRYTPASIIRELENKGLGTKSTRAQIIDTLYQRDYIRGTQLEATQMGMMIVETLLNKAPKILDEELTRKFEDEMQLIREEKKTEDEVLEEARKVLTEILDDFKSRESELGESLADAQKKADESETIGDCPLCDGKIIVRKGRFGRFAACNNYPDCKTTYNLPNQGFIESTDKVCEICKAPVILIKFKGRKKQEICSNPKCESRQPKDSQEEKPCPKCKDGLLKLRSSVYGDFYGCINYPKCKHTEKVAGDKKNKK